MKGFRVPSSRTFTIGVSLKMYFSHARTVEWCDAVAAICSTHIATTSGVVDFFVLPSFPSIPTAAQHTEFRVGGQDIATNDLGPFTGEVSGTELRELGCTLAEVGHAERRRLFAETDAIVAAKMAAAFRNGLEPVLCVGEASRSDPKKAAAICVAQIASALEPARSEGMSGPIIVAYEPLWAIGVKEPAPADHIVNVIEWIRSTVDADPQFRNTRVIYGGSAGAGLLPRISTSAQGMFLGRFAHDPQAVLEILDEAYELSLVS